MRQGGRNISLAACTIPATAGEYDDADIAVLTQGGVIKTGEVSGNRCAVLSIMQALSKTRSWAATSHGSRNNLVDALTHTAPVFRCGRIQFEGYQRGASAITQTDGGFQHIRAAGFQGELMRSRIKAAGESCKRGNVGISVTQLAFNFRRYCATTADIAGKAHINWIKRIQRHTEFITAGDRWWCSAGIGSGERSDMAGGQSKSG